MIFYLSLRPKIMFKLLLSLLRNLPSNVTKEQRGKEPQKVVSSQALCQDRQTFPSRSQLTAVSERGQPLTYSKIRLNKKVSSLSTSL